MLNVRSSYPGLIDEIYPANSLHDNITGAYLNDRAILATTNYDVAEINDSIINDRMSGELKCKMSANIAIELDDQHVIGPETLAGIDNPSLPPHLLRLKQNCPVMCIRNLNPVDGL